MIKTNNSKNAKIDTIDNVLKPSKWFILRPTTAMNNNKLATRMALVVFFMTFGLGNY